MASKMSPSPDSSEPPSDARWARPVSALELNTAPRGTMNLNVHGRHLTGPLQGFGQMWQKTYKVRLTGATVSPDEVIRTWKTNFPYYWPKGSHFYAPFAGIVPGEVALINQSGPGNLPFFSTGVMIIYVDDEAFTFMTPEGHPFAGFVTFQAYVEDGVTVAQAQVLIRANDPLYELGFRLGVLHKGEDMVWHTMLTRLARAFGVEGSIIQKVTCIDSRVQWSKASNIFFNAGIRSMIMLPVVWMRKLLRGANREAGRQASK